MTHRPYPAPASPPVMHQVWHDLLFMHWPIHPRALRDMIPPALEIDTFDGMGWIAVVPFRMSGIRPRALPAVPWLSAFPELNVRTYVIADGRPGVWFFSLDAGNGLAVQIARTWFSLPYFHARMHCAALGEDIDYVSHRTHAGAPPADFTARYGPAGAVFDARPGSIEWFLTARYCLYTQRRGRLMRGEIEHPAWPLQPARAEVGVNTMIPSHGLAAPAGAPLLHFARRLDVVVWPLEPCGHASPPAN